MPTFLTPEQEALFDLHVQSWATRLGLEDWNLYRRPSRAPGAMADITPDLHARHAGYRTGNWTHIAPSPEEIERVALHEVLHVFVAELLEAATSADTDWVATAEHRVINTLVKKLIP